MIEDHVIREMSSCGSAFDYTNSSWNQTLNENQIGLLVRETSTYTCPQETYDYECVLAEADHISESHRLTSEFNLGFAPGGVKYLLVYGNEYGNNKKKFHLIPRPDEVSHIELWRAMSSRITAEAQERLMRINQRFQKTLYTFLYLVKPHSLG